MSSARLLWFYLWITPHVMLVGVIYAMVRRQVHRQFPMFFLYSALEILQFAVLALMLSRFGPDSPQYHYAYSLGLALSTATRFGVIYELFHHFFRRYPLLTDSLRFLFRGATVALLLTAVGLAVFAPGNGPDFLLNVTGTLDRTASILQGGLLISLFLFSGYFALSWRSHAFGIALGMGVLASSGLAISALRLHHAAFGNNSSNLLSMGMYHCSVLIWLFYMWAPEREAAGADSGPGSGFTSMRLPSHDLDLWNQELQRLLQQ